jgi:hypothetical protein
MSDYTKSTNFATKDNLSSGNPLKIVKGTEIDTEFNNIATAVATKADLASPTLTGSPVLPTGTTGVTQSAGNNSTALATTAFVQAALNALYPVGSIYMNSSVTTNPATLLGFGTWVAFGAGRVPVGYNSSNSLFDTLEETGGSADSLVVTHTHSATFSGNALSAHSHTMGGGYSPGGGGGIGGGDLNSSSSAASTSSVSGGTPSGSVSVASAGDSGTNANYQPYITVAMWKRTA